MNNLRDDPCSISQRNDSNNKKVKYITTNFKDLLEAKEKFNFFGMTTKDKLFVPAEDMDKDSKIRYGENGNILTQLNVRQSFGTLPMATTPGRYQMSHGDVEIEDKIRLSFQDNKKSVLPSDSQFFNRSFFIFDDSKGIDTPKPEKFIEKENRAGVSTRFPPKIFKK
jgi:hypothetical protein